jgi:hypothetical protein
MDCSLGILTATLLSTGIATVALYSFHFLYDFVKLCHQCNFCGTETVDLKRCSRCESVYYCDSQCQKKDW